MTLTTACGPLWRADGPPPQPPKRRLLSVARVLDDADGEGVERWINGLALYPYPNDLARVWDANAGGSQVNKSAGGVIPKPEFDAMVVYLAETCSSLGIFGAGLSNAQAQDRFVARAQAALDAVESAALEAELMAGGSLPMNPYLANGNGTFPWGNTATTVVNGIALLENEIADSGRAGVIHMSPAAAIAADAGGMLREDRNGVLVTTNGTPIVAGYGYQQVSTKPAGHSAPANALQEWIYATGPIDVRRTPDAQVIPGELWQALDRASNTITYRVERYFVVSWDTAVQAAVLIDRCTTNCGTPS